MNNLSGIPASHSFSQVRQTQGHSEQKLEGDARRVQVAAGTGTEGKIQGKTSKASVADLGQSLEAKELKEKHCNMFCFLTRILSFLRTLLSYINIFAYLSKNPKIDESALPLPSTAAVKEAKQPPSSQQLSSALNFLIEKLIENEDNLKEEGIFRIPGSKTQIDQLVEQITSTQDIKAEPETNLRDVTTLTGALKAIVKQMELFEGKEVKLIFFEVQQKTTDAERIQKFKELVAKLNLQQLNDLKIILSLLAKILEYKHQNKMNEANLATCFALNFMPSEFMRTVELNNITQHLIRLHKEVFAE